MMLRLSFIGMLCHFVCLINAQSTDLKSSKSKKTYPSKTDLAIGAGYTKSVVFLERNVKPNNDATGITYYLIYGGARLMRSSIEFTKYNSIDIIPTWYNIKAYTVEWNIHTIAKLKDWNANFFPMFGLSFNHFEGYYTGKSDYLGLNFKYPRNTVVVNNWVGLNLGIGYEHRLGPFRPFFEYKMRVGPNYDRGYRPNIMDVCMGIGIRYNFRIPTIYAIRNGYGLRNRYFLDKQDH